MWISQRTPYASHTMAVFRAPVMPPRFASMRLMSDAPRRIHSARVNTPPATISGERIGIVSSRASRT